MEFFCVWETLILLYNEGIYLNPFLYENLFLVALCYTLPFVYHRDLLICSFWIYRIDRISSIYRGAIYSSCYPGIFAAILICAVFACCCPFLETASAAVYCTLPNCQLNYLQTFFCFRPDYLAIYFQRICFVCFWVLCDRFLFLVLTVFCSIYLCLVWIFLWLPENYKIGIVNIVITTIKFFFIVELTCL